jgi:hypothetical protein
MVCGFEIGGSLVGLLTRLGLFGTPAASLASRTATMGITLPPDKGVHHVSNPISYTAVPDVPQGNEAYAREGNGRA